MSKLGKPVLLRKFLRQLGSDQVVRLLNIVLPLFAAEFVDVLDEYPFIACNVWRRTHARRTRQFVELLITHLEGDCQWPFQRSNAKHLTGHGETEVVAPFEVFSDH